MITAFLGEVENRVARDAVQARGQLRRVDDVVAHDKDVLARTFRHIAFGIEQQRFFGAAGQRFLQCQHRVDVVAVRLRARHRDIDVMARVRTGANLDAELARFRRHVRRPVPRRDNHMHFETGGAQAHAFGTEKHHRPNIGFAELVLAHRGALRLVDLVPC